ncbi:acetate--CoA ligase family protein [Rhodococcus koreensis]
MTAEHTLIDTHPVERLLKPRSVVIVGMSSKPGSIGLNLLTHLQSNGFDGDVHLVGRNGGEVDGIPVLTEIGELPPDIDLALIALPAQAVADAIAQLAERRVQTGIIYASGFAEFGDEGREQQAAIRRTAVESGLRLAGPNCIGYNNFIDGIRTVFLPGGDPLPRLPEDATGAIAVVAQSGAMISLITNGLGARKLSVGYAISTGNEVGLNLADYLDYLADDPAIGGVVMYIEEIRDPQAFLAAVRSCRARGKNVILLHAGRTERGQHAAASHTGALAGDFDVIHALVTRAGACVAETMEELLDTAEILTRSPKLPTGGLAFATTSGGYCVLALDTLTPLGVDVPDLAPATVARLEERIPSYMHAANPFDLGTVVAVDHELFHDATRIILDDDGIGAVILGIGYSSPSINERSLRHIARAKAGSDKPVLVAFFCDVVELPDELRTLAAENGIVLSNSPERLMRAAATISRCARALASAENAVEPSPLPGATQFGREARVEWSAKAVAAELGIPVPRGGLATSADEAVAIAARIGYPVAAKAQSPHLMHKTEAGAVVLDIRDEAALHAAYDDLVSRASAAVPGGVDGILIEEMAPKGVELMVGAKRHPLWGPVVLVGLGGIWVEALGDVRLLPPDLDVPEIVSELHQLRAAKLLGEFRGRAPLDLAAVADVVSRVGRLMLERPDITELDINPLSVRPDGVLALDVLMSFGDVSEAQA